MTPPTPLINTSLGLSTKEVLTFGGEGQAKLENNTDRERAMSIKQISFSAVDGFLALHVICIPARRGKGLLNGEMSLARERRGVKYWLNCTSWINLMRPT